MNPTPTLTAPTDVRATARPATSVLNAELQFGVTMRGANVPIWKSALRLRAARAGRAGASASGRRLLPFLGVLLLAAALPALAAKRGKEEAPVVSLAPTNFATMPKDHPLASIWNDPEFAKRLIGSYGFASDIEPRMTPEEQTVYRDKILPLLREDPKKALPALQEAVKPSASAIFDFTLGNVYFQNDDTTNAVKHFETALAKFPDFRRAQKNLAFALVRQGRYADAIKPLLRTITLGGADGKVYGLLGFAYTDAGKPVSAEGAYRQALVFEPENMDFKMGLLKCSLATANYDHALALLDELLEQYPERESLWTLQANIYIQKEQPAKAAISLELLRRLGKATPQTLFLLGDLHMAQEAPELALAAYTEALELDGGKNPGKALSAAQILVGRGAWTEARALFGKIRGTAGGVTGTDELKLLKLESKVAIASGEGDRAITTVEQIIQRDPLDAESLLIAGDYYAKNGQPEKAALRFDTASKISGFEADAFVKHAQLLVQGQKYPQAVELLRKAQKLKPRDNVQRYLEKVEQLARAGGAGNS
jgi:tetratricopeptide (TPR) repeat protein